jgi:predicted acylesterase/phospholipase RssA
MKEQTGTKAIVFSGGGAYGAYEVGVMKALSTGESPATADKPLDADVFTGTSVGNFNAAVLTMLPGNAADAAKRLEQIWLYEIADRGGARGNGVYRIRGNPPGYLENTGFKNPFEPLFKAAGDAAYLGAQWAMRATQFMTSSGALSNRALGLIDVSAFISVDPFVEMLQRTIMPARIRVSPKILRIIATNWDTGEVKVFTNKDITDEDGRAAIMASASIPGVFPPVKIGENSFVDGGVVMNTPISYALDAGATELHVIYLNPDVRTVPLQATESTIDVFDRVMSTVMCNMINQDIATATTINKGLEALERVAADAPLDPTHANNMLRVVSKIYKSIEADQPYRKITIHRHHPSKDLGGPLSILNFSQGQIRDFIELGYNDTRSHDCVRNGCLIPNRAYESLPTHMPRTISASGA